MSFLLFGGIMKITRDTHLCLSIVATGKCNCNCNYCHFYASHDRKTYSRDISKELFKRYVEYISYLKTITPHLQVRLSGGEPLVMGDKVFDMTDYIAEKTGVKPYIMTNGKLLSKEIIDKAYEHNVSSFVVSVENPFDVSEGAIDARETINKYAKLQNEQVPLYFGMMVLANNQYSNIFRIADMFYELTGTIPPMCEINYLPYESPTKEELEILYCEVKKLVKKYNGKTPLSLFPYVIPEYYSGNRKSTEYLTEFPIDDKHDMMNTPNELLICKTEKQIDRSYFAYECENRECDWYDSCRYLKWVWQMDTPEISAKKKMKDYCELKQVLSNAFFDALVGES